MICTENDSYVREIPRWVVDLDDGTIVYQDDDRPGISPPSAWIRLGDYCRQNNRHIVKMRLQFRSNIVNLPEGGEAYYFSRMAFGVLSAGAETYDGFVAGTVQDGVAELVSFKVPELVPVNIESRRVDCHDCRVIGKLTLTSP